MKKKEKGEVNCEEVCHSQDGEKRKRAGNPLKGVLLSSGDGGTVKTQGIRQGGRGG
jgi:hypothetical protein